MCNRDARRHLHPPLKGEQGRDVAHDHVVARTAAAEGTLRVVRLTRAVEADRYREAVLLEELTVLLGEERPVGRGRERDLDAALRRKGRGAPGGSPEHVAVDQR